VIQFKVVYKYELYNIHSKSTNNRRDIHINYDRTTSNEMNELLGIINVIQHIAQNRICF